MSTPQELPKKLPPSPDELRRALSILTPAQQSLLLRFHQNLNQDERSIRSREDLCKEFGISMTHLRVRVARLRHKVIKQVEAKYPPT